MSDVRVHNPCPHCGASGRRRSLRQVTPTVATGYYQCTDVECSAAWVAQTEITHLISESAKPNPRICIPFRPVLRTSKVATPTPANDPEQSPAQMVN
ncbi:ogr/Delta-like zinc finger family protein [Brevundimonas nasdae]|uniref:ogr/Delta-like zinc finger family protein n=1 Tax=Brevundimonas nasdae TaxID=172043 RepID=UPI003F68D884